MTNPTGMDLKIPDAAFFDDYDTGQFVPPPQAKQLNERGRPQYIEYAFTAPGPQNITLRDANGQWLQTQDGFLKAIVKEGKLETGYEIGQIHIGTKQYQKRDKEGNVVGQRNSSPAGDYFRAFNLQVRPTSAEEYESYFQMTANQPARVTIDWSAYDAENKQNVADSWDEFPKISELNPESEEYQRYFDATNPEARLPYIERNGKRFWARAGVKRWVSSV